MLFKMSAAPTVPPHPPGQLNTDPCWSHLLPGSAIIHTSCSFSTLQYELQGKRLSVLQYILPNAMGEEPSAWLRNTLALVEEA